MDQATTRVEEVIMAILHDRTKKELYGEANSLAVVVEAYNVLKPERLFAISLITYEGGLIPYQFLHANCFF